MFARLSPSPLLPDPRSQHLCPPLLPLYQPPPTALTALALPLCLLPPLPLYLRTPLPFPHPRSPYFRSPVPPPLHLPQRHQKCKSSKSPKFSMPVLARCRFPLNHPHERPGRDLAETPPFVPCGPKKGAKNLILAKRRAAAPKYAQSSAAAGGGKGNALCGAVHLYCRCGSLRPPPGKKNAAAGAIRR